MMRIQITFIAACVVLLVFLAVYLYKQFEHKLDLEWKEFEENQRSVEHENIELP